MNAHTERIFAVLVELDPLVPVAGTELVATADGLVAADGPDETTTAARIARIVAQPRSEPIPTRSETPRPSPAACKHPRARVGALGLLMSAAIAAVTMLLWASPSGGEPASRSIDLPARVASAPPAPVTVGRA